MTAEGATTFTEPQERVLDLLGHGHEACLRPELDEALDDLIAAGFVRFRAPLTPALTSAGWEAFHHLEAKSWT